jgi:hypothetical protein
MASQAIERRAPQVPALIRTPALTITAEDVALPRLYIGQFMSKAVQEQLVKMGDVYSATGADDPDPQILWKLGDKKAPGVLFHVLGLRKGKSISDGGELQLFDYDDPNAPADAWVTYNYTIACPEQDTDVPYKLLLTKTGRPAALQINTVFARNAVAGPAWINAFRLTTAERENAKGKFAVPRVHSVEATKDHIKVAEGLAVMMSSVAVEHTATGEQPAI